MKMVSYWSDVKEFYVDDGLVLITGKYNHKNEYPEGEKKLGVHWGTYPQSRGVLSPCVIPESTRNAILSGLLHQAVINRNQTLVTQLIEANQYFDK